MNWVDTKIELPARIFDEGWRLISPEVLVRDKCGCYWTAYLQQYFMEEDEEPCECIWIQVGRDGYQYTLDQVDYWTPIIF